MDFYLIAWPKALKGGIIPCEVGREIYIKYT